jgi:hypothetical protein
MRRFPRELLIALLIALVHGLLYVFIVPPWQHYDEPTHAEYAWLIANKTPRPTDADITPNMRLWFARSMAATGFYDDKGGPPNLNIGAPTPNIGYSQLRDRPTYYWLAALPMMALRGQAIETQLRAARMVSLLLLLLTVTSAWGVATTISPSGHPLRTLLPCGMALLPAFIDLMTAVNNDAGAIAMFSLFLWGAMRLLKQRSGANAAWVALSAIAAAAMKSTALFALPLALIVFVLAFVKSRLRWMVLAAIPAALAVIALIAISSGDPANWYRNAAQDAPLRCEGAACGGQLGAGQHAFAFSATDAAQEAPALIQLLPLSDVARLQGQTVTMGAWLWTDGPTVTVQMPALRFYFYGQPDNPIVASRAVAIGPQPAWHTLTLNVPAGARYGNVTLQPAQNNGTVFMSELMLVAGEHPMETPANLAALQNAIRNNSADEVWPWLRAWAQARITNLFSDPLRHNFLLSPLDRAGAGHYYDLSAQLLFETFWARFSWAQVALPPAVFSLLLGFTALSLALTWLTWPRWRRWLRADQALVLGLALLALWLLTLLRGTPLLDVLTFLNVARYTYPAIIPALVLLLLGWSEVALMLAGKPRALRAFTLTAAVLGLALAAASLLTIAAFFG